jgi:hypothetical protein
MHTDPIRAHGTVMDGWPILVAFALYLVVFGVLAVTALPVIANAHGCVKGAVVGGVVGHVAGHHGVVGAAVGCAVGHHEAKVKEKQAAQAQAAALPAASPRLPAQTH